MFYVFQNIQCFASSFHLGLKSAQPKTENDSNGGKRAPYFRQKVNHFFFIGYNKTAGAKCGPGFFKTKIKKNLNHGPRTTNNFKLFGRFNLSSKKFIQRIERNNVSGA